jgi:diguanylate cyclase (GGDEF)-like protein
MCHMTPHAGQPEMDTGGLDAAASAGTNPVKRPVLHMRKDETGVIRHIDHAVTQVLGDHDKVLASWVRLLAVPETEQRLRLRHSDCAGQWVWFEMVNHNLLRDPTSPAVLTEMVALGDVPQEDADWYTAHLLHRLTETLPVGILALDRAGRTVFRNARLTAVLGHSSARAAQDMFGGLVSADRRVLDEALDAVLDGHDGDIEVGLTHPDLGERRCGILLRALTDRSGQQITGAVLCLTDVTEAARAREEMRRRAAYDGLTGCLNRESVLHALGAALAACGTGADSGGVAVVFVDMDRFKAVNDEFGHPAGDLLLCTVAERLRATARVSDFVGRVGGDEFLLVFPGAESARVAVDIGKRIAAALGRPLDLGGSEVTPSASVGVAWTADGTVDPYALVAAADEAMYRSKRDGAGQPVLYGASA